MNGDFLLSTVQNFPVSVIAKSLRVCIEAGWSVVLKAVLPSSTFSRSDELYSHLLRLLIKLLYLPRTEGRGLWRRLVSSVL